MLEMADSELPYKPPSHLVARPFLTSAQLVSEFESLEAYLMLDVAADC